MSDSILLKSADGDSAEIHLHGATVTSWKCRGQEMLLLSKNSVFDGKKAIRGGIPVIFPNFGPWELGPQHGFARISRWNLEGEPKVSDNTSSATLVLKDSDFTRKMWNFRFKLAYTVTVGQKELSIKLTVQNKDNKPFDFTTLLHTYFRVQDVTKTTVSGFGGLTYVDKVRGGQSFTEANEPITVDCLTDRVYANTPDKHVIANAGSNYDVLLEKCNLPDTVVWNPWEEKAKAMSDFGDDEYPFMLCVEAGHVSKPYILSPDSKFECGQKFTCIQK